MIYARAIINRYLPYDSRKWFTISNHLNKSGKLKNKVRRKINIDLTSPKKKKEAWLLLKLQRVRENFHTGVLDSLIVVGYILTIVNKLQPKIIHLKKHFSWKFAYKTNNKMFFNIILVSGCTHWFWNFYTLKE